MPACGLYLPCLENEGSKCKQFSGFLNYFPTYILRPHFIQSKSTFDAFKMKTFLAYVSLWFMVSMVSVLWARIRWREWNAVLLLGLDHALVGQQWPCRKVSCAYLWIALVLSSFCAFSEESTFCQLIWLVKLDWPFCVSLLTQGLQNLSIL